MFGLSYPQATGLGPLHTIYGPHLPKAPVRHWPEVLSWVYGTKVFGRGHGLHDTGTADRRLPAGAGAGSCDVPAAQAMAGGVGSAAQVMGVVWEDRAARLTLLLFCWWFGWHFLMGG